MTTVTAAADGDDGDGGAKKFSIHTLGCKVNSFESELIAEQLLRRNCRRVDADTAADLCVINTCTVTVEADRQARQLVRRAVRRNPDATVVVTGCYAQTDADAVAAIPGVDMVVGNAQKLDIPKLLDAIDDDGGQSPVVMVSEMDDQVSLPSQLVSGFDGRARAFMQVQQGCDQGCTFCIIHKARGPNRSLPAAMIRRQAERLVMNGYRELVLCGVDIGSYGHDTGGGDLTGLLTTLTDIAGDFRIRLSSIDPAHLTDELIELLAASPKLCPQLHLSLQSANTLILKRMKRRATREIIFERIAKLRRALPELVLSADLIAGFPTESDAQFADTVAAVDALEIAYPHVFAYSPRPGTPAARIPTARQVPPTVRKQRAASLRDAGKAVWRRVARRRVGVTMRVLVEGVATVAVTDDTDAVGTVKARAADYFPVVFASAAARAGAFAAVTVTGVGDSVLIADAAADGYNTPPSPNIN